MKSLIVFAVAISLSSMAQSEIRFEGDKSLLQNGGTSSWSPKNVKLGFTYNDGKITGYVAQFETKSALFNDWKIITDEGEQRPFPFVMEVSLIVPKTVNLILPFSDVRALVYTERDTTKGTHWHVSFSSDTACHKADTVYPDAINLDWAEPYDANKYGIGIYGELLREGGLKVAMQMDLKPAFLADDPLKAHAYLRFRLGVDVSALKRIGLSKDSIEEHFKFGKGWEGFRDDFKGYDRAPESEIPTPDEIAKHYSFSIDEVYGVNNPGLINSTGTCSLATAGYCDNI